MIPKLFQGRMTAPVIAAPMFLVSGPHLVIEACKAGIAGTFPTLNARPIEVLDEWLTQINAELGAQYMRNREYQTAMEKLTKAVELNPRNVNAHGTPHERASGSAATDSRSDAAVASAGSCARPPSACSRQTPSA